MVKRETISSEDYELYVYAFETIIVTIVNIVFILTIGIVFNRFTETLLFLAFYCPIRQFSGGFHAENYFRCTLSFISIYLLNIFLLNKLINLHTIKHVVVLALISYIGIVYLSPQEHRNVPLEPEEKKIYKRIVIYITSFLVAISIISINYTITYVYAMYGFSVIIWIFIMQILGLIKEKGGINL